MKENSRKMMFESLAKSEGFQSSDPDARRMLPDQKFDHLGKIFAESLYTLSEFQEKLHASIVADIEEASRTGERIVIDSSNYDTLRQHFANQDLSVFVVKGENNA